MKELNSKKIHTHVSLTLRYNIVCSPSNSSAGPSPSSSPPPQPPPPRSASLHLRPTCCAKSCAPTPSCVFPRWVELISRWRTASGWCCGPRRSFSTCSSKQSASGRAAGGMNCGCWKQQLLVIRSRTEEKGKSCCAL